jgi:3-oxoacyl-[acyl-carrier-protein] synthase II
VSNRVVVTGMHAHSPLGTDWSLARDSFLDGSSGVTAKPEWRSIEGLESHVAGEVDLDSEQLRQQYPPRTVRSMGRGSLVSLHAAERALREAGLWEDSVLENGDTGISFGSTEGSETSTYKFFRQVIENETIEGIKMADFIKRMPHTIGANLSQALGITGRLIPTSTACTSGSQGVGYGYEAIKNGHQSVMVTGGAEALVKSAAAVFNVMMGASTYNDRPESTPRPFDESRDGLVVAEGGAVLVLESLEHARDRGAEVLAEVVGFATNCNGGHTTIPSTDGIRDVMTSALEQVGLSVDSIDYISAHATATEEGDLAESNATEAVFGSEVPVSSLKSYMGHTLGGCGAIESVYGIRMMNEGWVAPTLHLEDVDENCGDLDYVRGEPREIETEYIMNNNFAFGGVNTSIVLKNWSD